MQTRPRPSAPPLWQGWCRCLLGLSASDAADWWEALSRAASGPAATLRHVVLYHSTRKLRFAELMSLVREVLTPQALVEALAACVEDGTVPRLVATRWEEAIFVRMRLGVWRGEEKTLAEVGE